MLDWREVQDCLRFMYASLVNGSEAFCFLVDIPRCFSRNFVNTAGWQTQWFGFGTFVKSSGSWFFPGCLWLLDMIAAAEDSTEM